MAKNECHKNRGKRTTHNFATKRNVCDYHHLIPRSKGGESIGSNLLKIDVYRHDAFHLLFKDRTILEIISILKKYNTINDFMKTIDNYFKWKALLLLFGKKNIDEIIYLLERINRAKFHQKFEKLKLAKVILAA
jgi:hypothetical protein